MGSRIKIVAFVLLTVSAMAWIVAICEAAPPSSSVAVEQAFVRARKDARPQLPDSLARSGNGIGAGSQSVSAADAVREVVIIVPDFACPYCDVLERNLAQIPGVKSRRERGERDVYPYMVLPDAGRKQWKGAHSVESIKAILRDNPPLKK